jgi:tetratricopeptide (TPR) repeat protein
VKVEQALRILPGLEALAPLRGLLFSSALSEEDDWAGSAQKLTVGKREVSPEEMRRHMATVLEQIVGHFSALYEGYVHALECLQGERPGDAVSSLLEAGRREEVAGRLPQARVWLGVALGIAKGLQNRRPEVETLLELGRLSSTLGSLKEGARHYGRALAVAQAEFDNAGASAACEGLGDIEAEQANWDGARSWYDRALGYAEVSQDERRIAQTLHALGELARRTGELQMATDTLKRAHDQFEAQMGEEDMARVLTTEAMVLADLGLPARAAAAYREALAWAWRGSREPETEVFIRLNFARLHIETASFIEAEEEIRRAEQLAIAGNHIRQLAQIYTLLGRLRGRQEDEAGFVFFEQAIALARMLGRVPGLEAEIYQEYAAFKYAVGARAEAEDFLERARTIRADWIERLSVPGGRRATDIAGAIS